MAYGISGMWGQPEPPRRRGLLSRAAQYGAQPLEAEAQGPRTSQLSLMPQMTQQVQASPWTRIKEGINGIQPQTWFQIAGGLLDRAEGEGTWGQALGGIGTALEGQQDRALRQEDVDYTRGQRQQEAQQRQAREAWIASLPPDQQALARVAPDAIVGAQAPISREAQARIDYERERAKTADAQWEAGHNLDQQRLGLQRREIGGQNRSPYYAQPTGRDAAIFQQYEGVYGSSQEAINNLQRTKQLIQSMAQAGAMGQPVDAAMRFKISRLTGSNPEARALFENLNAQVWPVVLKNLEGLAPVTNVELSQAMQRTINADMTPASAIAEIDRLIQNAQRAQATAGAGLDFTSQGGSYATGRNAQGQTWREVLDATQKPFAGVAAIPERAPTATQQQRPNDLASLIDSVLSPQRQPGSRITPQQLARIPVAARQEMMRRINDPQARAAFDQQYGAGASDALRRAAAPR